MSFSSPTVAEIRSEIGSPSTTEIADATLTSIISQEVTYYGSAYRAAEQLQRYFAVRAADYRAGNYSESFSQRAKAYADIVKELRTKMESLSAQPYFGATSVSDIDTREDQTDRPDPDFERNMFKDNWT